MMIASAIANSLVPLPFVDLPSSCHHVDRFRLRKPLPELKAGTGGDRLRLPVPSMGAILKSIAISYFIDPCGCFSKCRYSQIIQY